MTSNQKGFSLIEVMIAIVVLVVGVIGLVRLQSYFDKESEYAIAATEAMHIAEAELERLSRRGSESSDSSGVVQHKFDDIHDETRPVVGSTSARFTLVRTVENWTPKDFEPTLSDATVEAKLVTVKVSWLKRDGEQDSISLKTMISRYSEFE